MTAATFSVLATFVINIIIISKVRTSSTIQDGNKLIITIEGTILSHSYNQIQRCFNQAYKADIQEVIFDIRNASLHAEEIMDFGWITNHAKRGVKVTIVYKELMEEKLHSLFRLNPEIAGFNQQIAET